MKKITPHRDPTITDRDALGSVLGLIETYEPLSRKEEEQLILSIQAGRSDLKEQLVLHNLRFVLMTCKQLQVPGERIRFDDLFAAGLMGMWEAIGKVESGHYRVERGNRFVTYAVKYIQGSCYDCMGFYNPGFKLPIQVLQEIIKMSREEQKHAVEYGEVWDDATKQEFFSQKWEPRTSSDIVRAMHHEFLHQHDTIGVRTNADSLVEWQVSPDHIMSDDSYAPDRFLDKKSFQQELEAFIDSDLCNHREAYVLVHFFGFWNVKRFIENPNDLGPWEEFRHTGLPPEVIADDLGITRARFWQIKREIISKLRVTSYYQIFNDYLTTNFQGMQTIP